jgi:tetratricopeptide (TPR) repeat protein
MSAPRRSGLDARAWAALLVRYDRMRERALTRARTPAESGGTALLWQCENGLRAPRPLVIEPGVADDLPSLLSALAPELAWPGAPPGETPVCAVWARLWQVREGGDLRVRLWWDVDGIFHGEALHWPLHGAPALLAATDELVALLDRLAVAPEASRSPHGLLLAGNRAMHRAAYAEACALYRQALQDLPAHLELHRNLALALARLEDWEGATAAMHAARALAPDDPALNREYLALETDAGIRAVQAEDLPRAAEHFLRVLALWPTEPTALANLGAVRVREGRSREARAILQRFLRLHPDHPGANPVQGLLASLGDEA